MTTQSITMLAPNPNEYFTCRSGNSYTADAYGYVKSVIGQDILDLAGANCISLGILGARSNLSATTNPGATNDSTQDYAIGSHWLNTTTGVEFVCQVATASAAVWVALGAAALPLAAGATLTLTALNSNQPILLNTAAGSVITLPAATGTGNKFKCMVDTTTTSGAHKILAASSSDFINGIAWGFTGSTAKVFASAASTNHSIQMPFTGSQPSGGFIGDSFTLTDIATNLWQCEGYYQAGTTPTTPFSSATS